MKDWDYYTVQSPMGLYSLVEIEELRASLKDAYNTEGWVEAIWKDPRVFPLYAVSASTIILLLHLIVRCLRPRKDIPAAKISNRENDINYTPTVGTRLRNYASRFGGSAIFAYMVARLIGCMSLLGLSIATSASNLFNHQDIRQSTESVVQWGIIVTYVYTSFLAAVAVVSPRWSTAATRHIIIVLLVSLGVYTYRDIWPLATTDLIPADIKEGWILWAKTTALVLTAAVIPLFIPRRYVPVDPEHPMEIPNPEQTACIFSMIVYIFLDPIIMMAAKVKHLSHSQLPPLCDYDGARYRVEKNFPHLDRFKGAKRRHIFWNLMRVYRVDYSVMATTIVGMVIFGFAPAIGINRMLNYLETGGAGTTIRPWFWILFLFIGPMARNMCFQWYIFIATRMLARTEGLLTHLVFEHSLRIRVKAETSKAATNNEQDVTAVATPDSGSVAKGKSRQASDASSTTSADTSTSSNATKGKDKANTASAKKSAAESKDAKQGDNLIGKINNLVTTDVGTIVDARDFLLLILQVPLQLVCCAFFLYAVLGWSAFVGIFSIFLMFPVPGYIAKKMQGVQKMKMKMTDSRVQTVTESINVIRMVKLFGWEGEMTKRIDAKREEELKWLWKRRALEASNGILNFVISALTMLVTYGTYTIIMKQELSASKIFSSMPVFSMLRGQLQRTFWTLNNMIQGKVALDRIDEFLGNTELLDGFSDHATEQERYLGPSEHQNDIGFQDATFSWSNDPIDGTVTPNGSTRAFMLRIEDKLLFKRNCINLIVGPTGSGKTSILMALLGEMHFIPTGASSWFNLPRNGGVAYAAQESWVQNETIRNNILFGAPYDEGRYNKVIRQCALERDLELFEAGDQTEVGERGLTLSGGQKARVTLARAIYSSAEILLLDDVLAALDVHTAKWIVQHCFKGDLVRGRTILLVTHNVALAGPLAEFVVSIGLDGKITSQGSDILRAIHSDPALEADAKRDGEELERGKEEIDLPVTENKKDGKLIISEEIAEGHVGWKSIMLYLSGLGGKHPVIFFTIWAASLLFTHVTLTFQVWFLGYWGTQYETHAPSDVQDSKYIGAYAIILLIMITIYVSSYLIYVIGSLRASRTIHKKLTSSVLSTTLRWLDETPTSRIIARCTQDIRAVDGPISMSLYGISEMLTSGAIELGAVVLFTPIFLIPGILVAITGTYVANIYLKAQLSTKREMSNAKSPMLAHFGAAINGLVSVRAYAAQEAFRVESLKRIDYYTRVARVSYNLNRWISVRTDLIGALFTAGLATYLVYRRSVSSANTGFSLNMASDFCQMILWGVRTFNEFEVQANSLERIQAYIDIEHEPAPTDAGIPPAAWPTSGSLEVEKLSARYSSNGPKVLHDISFKVKAGERIGVVGRTGSGKSSLTLSLLRCILTEGNVYYDGLLTNKINLDALRSHITIIPQSPELLSGTLRRNLDPLEQHDDATLNDALRSAGLFSLQDEMDEGRLTLESSIASGGGNLSVGQRQILALARAIVRRSKLLILDEATSAIDYKTDAIIQSTLRNELGPDVTVITVAHRLQTIMDADKIMVLDEGRIVEFDKPQVLLKTEGSKLKALVDESGDKATLYEMAENKASASQ